MSKKKLSSYLQNRHRDFENRLIFQGIGGRKDGGRDR